MFVNKINNFNIQRYFNVGSSKQYSKTTYPNLAPLARDTVSFRGVENKFDASCAEKPNFNDCIAVHDYAAAPAYYLYKVLDSHFSDFLEFVETPTSTQELGIKHKKPKTKGDKFGSFEIRTKSPASIYEKVTSKFDRLYKKEHNDFAEELYQNMIVLFPQMPNVSKDQIMAVIDHATDDLTSIKTSAFEHPEKTIREIMSHMRDFNFLDFSGSSDAAEESFIRAMTTKMGDYSSEITSEDNKLIRPDTIEGIKHYANDIVGARIVLNDKSPECAEQLIAALTKAVSSGDLKIVSVENIIPDEKFLLKKTTLSDYLYFTDKQFRPLEKAADIDVKDKVSKTGYMAVHINVDLSDDDLYKGTPDCNGFQGEIQIIGRDVERLKEIEDLCYKLKTNKKLKGCSYTSFKEAFSAYNEDTEDVFNEYTYNSYLRQRIASPNRRGSFLPTLQELGFEKILPQSLDFNNLRRCKISDETEPKGTLSLTQIQPKSKDEAFRRGLVNFAKTLIDWKFD